MLFNSIEFLLFFPIVTLLFFISPHRLQPFLLLIASCCFYIAFVPIYILILFSIITIDYIAGIQIEKNQGQRRKLFLYLSIIVNLSILFFFKYYNFFHANMAVIYESLLHREYPIHLLNIILPIGLSFHTFQSMSYTIEVYRGTQKAERNYHIFATYVMFYPQLVAGPIERPQNLIHQFYEKHTFNLQRVTNGLRLMTWGFFKKVVVADRLGLFVDQVYSAPFNHSGLSLLIATYFFAFQIYCDFSGYTDIARGTARVMGFELIPNFNLPYFARSVSEFWKRWHMSLSYWFRDYVYLPLGGNRVSLSRWTFNILVVFALSGIWHGANWTFLVWGLLNGLYIIVSKWSFSKQDPKKQSTHLKNSSVFIASVQVLFTFHLICVSWIFFRSSNIIDSIEILRRILTILNPFSNDELSLKVVNIFETQMGFALILGMVLIEYMTFKTKVGAFLQRQPIYLKGCTCVFVVIMILILGTFHSQKFIYFEF